MRPSLRSVIAGFEANGPTGLDLSRIPKVKPAIDRLTVDDLPPRLTQRKTAPAATSVPLMTLDELERRHILAVLQQCGGSRTAAAKILGLDRSTLWRKLERFGGEGG